VLRRVRHQGPSGLGFVLLAAEGGGEHSDRGPGRCRELGTSPGAASSRFCDRDSEPSTEELGVTHWSSRLLVDRLASWMDLVEVWFGILERQAIRRGVINGQKTSTPSSDLRQRVERPLRAIRPDRDRRGKHQEGKPIYHPKLVLSTNCFQMTPDPTVSIFGLVQQSPKRVVFTSKALFLGHGGKSVKVPTFATIGAFGATWIGHFLAGSKRVTVLSRNSLMPRVRRVCAI